MKLKIIVSVAFFSLAAVPHIIASSIDDFVQEYPTKSVEQRILALKSIIDSSPDSNDAEVARLLLADTNYEIAKRDIASQMLELAESRAGKLSMSLDQPFSRSAIAYDALSVLNSISVEWLSSSQRERALLLSEQLFEVISDAPSSQPDDAPISSAATETKTVSVDDAIAIVNYAVEEALKENLSIINEAVPNRNIRKALDKCEAAREILMSLSPDNKPTSRLRWENAMNHLSSSVALLKERQRLKYTLWAEGLYRETEPTNLGKSFSDMEAMQLYSRLSEVSVSLIAEPSLARETTKRLYDLYDLVASTESKARLRYGAIVNLDKRKTLDDF